MTETTLSRDYSNFEGPDPKIEEDARRASHMAAMAAHHGRSGQGNVSHFVGTPRKAKHRGG